MKTMKYIAGAVLALAGIVACNQKEAVLNDSVEITLTATHEGHEAVTKTTVQDGGTQVYWESYEDINVFLNGYGSRFTSTNYEQTGVATFTGYVNALIGINEGLSDGSYFWGLYPYRDDAWSDGESVTTCLPEIQTGRAGSFARNTHITLARSNNYSLVFYNVCGGLRFSLTQEGVKKVVFEGNNGEAIAGTIRMAFEGGVPVVQEVMDGKSKITLMAPDGGAFETGQWYYIEAIPGALSDGFTMKLYRPGGIATYTSSKAVSVKRGIYGSLANIDEELVFELPTTEGVAVDLGLSVKWASCDLSEWGFVESPDVPGDFFAWGETAAKSMYSWDTYQWCNGDYDNLTKYNTLDGYGDVDNKAELDPEDDAASAILGAPWRMPTDAEWEELRDNCTWEWTSLDVLSGMLVTSNINGNSIFLPAGGDTCDGYIWVVGQYGIYWSSSLDVDNPALAWSSYFNISGDVARGDGARGRFYGKTIRPVCDVVPGLSISQKELTLYVGGSSLLTARVRPWTAANKSVSWSSSNPAVASVDENGWVTGLETGTAVITATAVDGGYTAECTVTVVEAPVVVEPEAVDLGLSVKWASFNVGASAPEEYGQCFAWGETEPKDVYDWSTYKWCNGDYNKMTKYCPSDQSGYWDGSGSPDGKTVLDPEDDAASVNWGSDWRMPTDAEWTELRENCTWTWTTQNGIRGRLVTSNINGNSIFLSAAGYRLDTDLRNVGSGGDYWSSSLYTANPSDAWYLDFESNTVDRYNTSRYFGFSVRPVFDPAPPVPQYDRYVSSISRSYVDNVGLGNSYVERPVTIFYDDQNRVSVITSPNGTCEFEYQGKEILIKQNGNVAKAHLAADGLVDCIYPNANNQITIERSGQYVDRVIARYLQNDQYVNEEIVCTRDENGRLIYYKEEGKAAIIPEYQENVKHPNINVDLTWAICSNITDEGVLAMFWLGMTGRLSHYIVEQAMFGHKSPTPGFGDPEDPGTYHIEWSYGQLGVFSGMTVNTDDDGYPIEIIYDCDVEEWKYDYWIEVKEKGGTEILSGSPEPFKTGNILGVNNFVYTLTYK